MRDDQWAAAPFNLDADAIAWVRSAMARLSTDDKIRQLFTLNSMGLDPETLAAQQRFRPGGITRRHSADMVAERALLEALRLDPQHTGARHDLGVVRFNSGSYGEAAAGFASTLKDDPGLGVARQNLEGVVLRWIQRTHLGMWAVWFLVRILVSAQVQVAAAVVWVLGVALLVWWTRRTVSTLAGDLRVVLWRVLRSSWLASLWFGCVVVAAIGTTVAALVPVLAVAVGGLVVAGLALLVGCLASWVRLGSSRTRP